MLDEGDNECAKKYDTDMLLEDGHLEDQEKITRRVLEGKDVRMELAQGHLSGTLVYRD
jgi:hypothetical protein